MGGISDSLVSNFSPFRVDTPTGGLEVPCVLTFAGKKNNTNKIPDLLTERKRKPPERKRKPPAETIVFAEFSTLKYRCLGEGLSSRGQSNSPLFNFFKRDYLIGASTKL